MMDILPEKIVTAITNALGSGPFALHQPYFNGNEWAYLKDCLDSTYVSSVGPYVERFEHDLATYTGAKHAVAVVNGTSALHIALKLAGVTANDEVLIPALTFVATANAVSYCGAIPHFVDSEPLTLGIDANKLRDYLTRLTENRQGLCINRTTGRVIRAVIPMHTFGHPADMEALLALANDFHLTVIEDAAESIGSTYYGQHTGTFGLMGILSFNGNKTITTGGGGAILTNDSNIAKRAKHLTTTAKVAHQWEFDHDDIGYNYRLPNINAALGCAQLEQLPMLLKAKRGLFARYQQAFSQLKEVKLIEEPKGCHSNYWLQAIMLETPNMERREAILERTNRDGFMTRPVWRLMSKIPHFSNCPQMDLSIARQLEAQLINIPSSAYDR